MSAVGSTRTQASLACAENFVSASTDALQGDLLGPEQEAALGLVARNLGVLAIGIGQGASLEAKIERESPIGVYVVGLSPAQEVAANLDIVLPDRTPGGESEPVRFTGVDIRRPRGSRLPSMHFVEGNPSTSLIVVYTDTAIDDEIVQKANNIYELTHVTAAYLHPERDPQLPRVQAIRQRRASHNEFVVLDSEQGYHGMLSEWVAIFMEMGQDNDFDENEMAARLEVGFPGPEQLTVRRAVLAETLASMYADPPTKEGGSSRVSDALIAAYQRHGYLPKETTPESTPDEEPERMLGEAAVEEMPAGTERLASPFNGEDRRWVNRQFGFLGTLGVAGTATIAVIEAGLEEKFGYGMIDAVKDLLGLGIDIGKGAIDLGRAVSDNE